MIKNKKENGSITLEAAMMVPMFIMLMLFVNGFFVFFMGQQVMSHTLLQTAKSMAYDPYARQKVTAEDASNLSVLFLDMFTLFSEDYVSSTEWYEGDEMEVAAIAKTRFIAYLEESRASQILEIIGVENGQSGLNFTGSSVEDGVLILKLSYKQHYIFDAFDFSTFDRNLEVKIKLFQNK